MPTMEASRAAGPFPLNALLIRATVVAGLGGLLFGFDTAVIAGTTRALTQLFGLGDFTLGVTVSIALVGTVVGAFASGSPGQTYGGREVLRVLALFYVLSALGCAFAWDWYSFLFARFLGGLAIGGSSVLGPVYIAELAPAEWRGRLVGMFQINIVIGILLAYLSNYLIAGLNLGAHEWRWMLGVAAIPAAVFLALLFTIPQSPRWLATQGRSEEGRQVLAAMGAPDAAAEMNEIVESIHLERTQQHESVLSAKYQLPLFLAVTIGLFNQLSGINAILYYVNQIFEQAGFGKMSSNAQAVAIGATNLVATLLGMALIDKLGRKTLLLTGAVGTAACLFGVSGVFFTNRHQDWLVWLLVAYIGFFAISQGAVIWVYISEIFPNRVRAKGQSVGSFSHWFMNALIQLIFPLWAARSGGFPFLFFGVMMVVQFLVVALWYPETKGATLEQLQHRLGI